MDMVQRDTEEKPMGGRWFMGLMMFGAIALVGCSDSQDVTLHDPGVYKGPVDPLVAKQGTPQQQEALLTRFKQVQTDR